MEGQPNRMPNISSGREIQSDTTPSFMDRFSYRLSVIINRLKNNLLEVEPGESRIKKILYYAKLKSKLMYKLFTSILRNIYILSERWPITILRHYKGELETVYSSYPYEIWMAKNYPREGILLSQKRASKKFVFQPLFYLTIPIETQSIVFINNTIKSIKEQAYANWILICVCDADTNADTMMQIEKIAAKDTQIKFVKTRSKSTSAEAKNEILATLESGKDNYLSILKEGDILSPDALFQYVVAINENSTKLDLIYSDDDIINENNTHYDPRFKQEWNPDTFLSQHYIGNAYTVKIALVKLLQGWNPVYENAHEFELMLRLTWRKDLAIKHIPKVLYSVLITQDRDNSRHKMEDYTENCCRAITQTLLNNGEHATVKPVEMGEGYMVRYKLEGAPLVSIIIPTKDKIEVLNKCIDSIFEKSTYKNFEIILIDNNSSQESFFSKVEQWKQEEPTRFRCIRTEAPFNFSYLMNFGVSESQGSYLVLLNNDTEIITPDWIERMLEQAQRKSIGVVGVKLLYPNNTVQHAGVIVGLGGGAGHILIGKTPKAIVYMNYLNNITNYSAVTAACVMISKDKYNEVGGFDEQFAVEFNDVDFCLRIKEKGYNNVYLPHVELYHYESISRGHPLASKVSYERHLFELGLLQSRWRQYISNDPCYSPNLSTNNENMTIRI